MKPKKFAVLLSYCGADYYGLQRNNDVPTIENELFTALLKANVITHAEFDSPHTMYFQKASRTDKGVSAVKQVLSCRLPANFSDLIPKVNELLPQTIRVVGAKVATRYFDSKSYCDGRTYSYMMPSYALCPPEALTAESYRVPLSVIETFNRILSLYKGTHNFHNFTSQKLPTDPSAQRYIVSIECGQPFVRDGLELVVVQIRGQSFMIHQIRKMIGLAIGIVRGLTTEDVIKRAYGIEKLDIPKAPGLGLMLEEVHYDRYNKKYSNDGIHEGIIWSEYADFLNNFKQEHIYSQIIKTEKAEHQMLSWLQTLPMHTFDIRNDIKPPQNPTKEEEVLFNLHNESEAPKSNYKRACLNADIFDGKRQKVSEDAKVKAESDDEYNVDDCEEERQL